MGVNHRTAPVEVRERLSFSEQSLRESLSGLVAAAPIKGGVILSTCNRTEFYVAVSDTEEAKELLSEFMAARVGVGREEIERYTYSHLLQDAVRHLFRVAAGLDSMLLGETQILGQVRQAYQTAFELGCTDRILNVLFHQAITTGKRVRSETGIDQHPISISYAAVELAKRVFGQLNGCSVLVIGAGKMSELTTRYLVDNGVSGVIVSNRSYERAVQLAGQFGGKAIRFSEMMDYLEHADIIISCTAASHYVVRLPEIREVLKKHPGKKFLMIDIAVPRDIQPEVGQLPGVTLYDIDDLNDVVDHGLAERKRAAAIAEAIIDEEVSSFMKWMGVQYVVPTIAALKRRGEEIKQKELRRALNRLGELSKHDQKVICSLANSIVNQLLHVPITQLKEYALTPNGYLYMEALQKLFQLQPDDMPDTEGGVQQPADDIKTALSRG